MKNLKNLSLERKGKVLRKAEMIKILGGGSYGCYEGGQLCCFMEAGTQDECISFFMIKMDYLSFCAFIIKL